MLVYSIFIFNLFVMAPMLKKTKASIVVALLLNSDKTKMEMV